MPQVLWEVWEAPGFYIKAGGGTVFREGNRWLGPFEASYLDMVEAQYSQLRQASVRPHVECLRNCPEWGAAVPIDLSDGVVRAAGPPAAAAAAPAGGRSGGPPPGPPPPPTRDEGAGASGRAASG